MAVRNIVTKEDPILHKVCRPVTVFDEHLWQILDDMADTLREANGVGLAAPQIGILRRYFIMDTGDGKYLEAINPVIVGKRGVQEGLEGCLSCPDIWGINERPQKVIMKAQDRFGNEYTYKGEDLMARCVCHEYDHLDGILFIEKAKSFVNPEELQEAE